MATIMVNGQECECHEGASIMSLLEERGIAPTTVVVEKNRIIIHAEAFALTMLHDGDELEILQFVGGG